MNDGHSYITKEELDKEILSLEESNNVLYRKLSKEVFRLRHDNEELKHKVDHAIFWNRFLIIISLFLFFIECFHLYHNWND